MFEQLADGVFRRRYETLDLNVGVVIGERGALVVDTRASHQDADELIAEVGKLTHLPIRWVVDTHWHWDHVFGNSRFAEAEIWGHDWCRRALEERGEAMKEDATQWFPERRAEFSEVVITPPSHTFAKETRLDIGDDSVGMSYHGLGHTDADIVVSAGDGGVLFVGDLLEPGATPYFEDGYPIEWPATVRSALEAGHRVIVPGHGDVMDRAAALAQLADLETVAGLARSCVTGESTVGDAARLGPYPASEMIPILTRAITVAG